MENLNTPRPFDEWRIDKFDRAEDAAYTFGNHLIKYCRDEVMKHIAKESTQIQSEKIKPLNIWSLYQFPDLKTK